MPMIEAGKIKASGKETDEKWEKTQKKKNDVFYCRYDDLIMIELRNGQRWPNNNDDKKRCDDLMIVD